MVELFKNEQLQYEQHQKNQECNSGVFLVFGISVNKKQYGYNDQQYEIDQLQSKH